MIEIYNKFENSTFAGNFQKTIIHVIWLQLHSENKARFVSISAISCVFQRAARKRVRVRAVAFSKHTKPKDSVLSNFE